MNDIENNINIKLQVLITGFDAMETQGILKNASGLAVKLLEQKRPSIEASYEIDLYTEVVPVQYQYVDECIPQLWTKVQPHLTVHVGISDKTKGLTLEKMATKNMYDITDMQEFMPPCGENPCPGPDTLATDLMVEEIREKYNENLPEQFAKAEISEEAGRYLCEYIYYTSMALHEQSYRRKTCLFVHVPYATDDEEIELISEQLERLLMVCVEYLRTHEH